ncbi:hypothetical protein K1719_010636 [Acacia pycnantha]|nr:hypothetical protein K1719_010636 [Acacia pycnantha]
MDANQISSPIVWKEAVAERILIGKVLSNKTYTRSAMELILRKAWNLQVGFDVIEIDGNAFMFKFADEDEYNRVLRGGHVGEVLLAEDPYYNGRYLRGFLRARVLLDLRRPLAYGFWLTRPNNEKIWISVRYEKLQSFCYSCGKLGHDNRNCGSERLMSGLNPNEPRFGAWLTTKLCRSWDEVVVVIKQDWSEAEHVRRKQQLALQRKRDEAQQASDTASTLDEKNLFFIKLNKATGDYSGPAGKEAMDRDASDVVKGRTVHGHGRGLGGNQRMMEGDDGGTEEGELESMLLKRVQPVEEDSDVPTKVSAAEGEGSPGRSSETVLPNPLALVVYNGGNLGEVIKGISKLGLKREAAEDWEASELKRRKLMLANPTPKPAISVLAENLRKTRAKIRRSAKRKGKEEKENISDEDMGMGNQLEGPVVPSTGEPGFVFKARRGGRKKGVAVEFKGSKFTWCNKREGGIVRESLDRALGNGKFRDDFEKAMVFHIDPIGSDHHALVIDCCYMEEKGVKPFKFEANWVQHDDFVEIVHEGWNGVDGTNVDKVLELVNRLDACREKLILWSKKAFPNFRKLISHLRSSLSSCHKGCMSAVKLSEAEELVRQIEDVWRKEEVYWWQRSRVSWLSCGDRNTKFFHSTVIQLRIRNKILRLKGDNGVWLEEKTDINKAFSDFYVKLFTSEGSRPLDQVLSYVDKVVTEEDNNCLMQPVSNQEIEDVVFQLGANKAPGPDGYSALFY